MTKCRLFAVSLLLALGMLTASAGHGQTILNAVGSSGVFPTTGLAAITADPVTGAAALCGTNFWSGGSGSATSKIYAKDGRNAGIPHENATFWVAWDTLPPTKICTYSSVDSVVGQRLFLSQTGAGNATLNFVDTTPQFTAGGNKVSFASDSCPSYITTGTLSFSVDITEASGTTATVTVHGGGSFSDYFANGAKVTIAGSTIGGFNAIYDGGSGHQPTIGGITQFDPTSFTVTTSTGSLGTDSSGSATATVTANCPGIPPGVFNALNGTHFTMAFTDIRPEDAHATFVRATCALSTTDPSTPCFGYSAAPASPDKIESSYSQDFAVGLDFALFGGTDPITSVGVPAGTIVDVGAVPIMWLASNRDTTACGLGNAGFTNVNIQDLQSAYRGITGATQDISAALSSTASGCPTPLWPVVREVFSGTYNTVEFQVIRSWQGGNNRWSQEAGNIGYAQSRNNTGTACPAWVAALPTTTASNPSFPSVPDGTLTQGCGDPLNIQSYSFITNAPAAGPYSGFGGFRTRVIGTGQMVSVLNSTNVKNALGYAFFSLGSLGGKANVKYVTLDGADPLWPSYAANPYGAGKLPGCTGFVNLGTFSCPSGKPTFDGVRNGSYRNWNIIRADYYGPLATCASPFTTVSAACLIQAAQDQANPVSGTVPDYVPVVYCNNSSCGAPVQNINYFRAHYSVSGVSGHNGHVGPPFTPSCPAVPESGGDVFGSVFSVNLEVAQLNSIGCTTELTGFYD